MRFVDEVNEKITIVQEACLAIYNGYYCINEILGSILYCCEHLNKKLYAKSFPVDPSLLTPASSLNQAPQRAKSNTILTYTSANTLTTSATSSTTDTTTQVEQALSSEKQLQNDYMVNVIEKLENVRKILNEIVPLNFRLELLENIYSLIFVSVNDLKESEDEDDTVTAMAAAHNMENTELSRYLDEAMGLTSDQNGIYFNLKWPRRTTPLLTATIY